MALVAFVLNNERKKDKLKCKTISDITPVTHLGYFPLKSIMDKLNVKKISGKTSV